MRGSKLLTSNTISIMFTVAGLRAYLTISRKKKEKTHKAAIVIIQKTIRKLITQEKEPYMIHGSVF